MIITKETTKTITEVADYICNKCSKSCALPNTGGKYFGGLREVKVLGSYSSEAFSDGDEYSFSICEPCLVEIFETFQINPFIYNRWDEGLI